MAASLKAERGSGGVGGVGGGVPRPCSSLIHKGMIRSFPGSSLDTV